MNLYYKFLYFGTFVLSMASAGICVSQIIQAEAVYAVVAAMVFVVAFLISIDGMLLHYFERLERVLKAMKDK